MTDYTLLAATLGIGLSATILYLIRRDHLYLRDGLFWIGVAVASIAFGIWPGLVDVMGRAVGVAYPPALLFLLAILVLVVRALMADIALAQLKREVRRLNQRMALIDAEARKTPEAAHED